MTKTVYLTIDDGPTADFINKLDYLTEHRIPAVWFCPGNRMEERPDAVIEAIRRGHTIGNHSYSHPHFSDLTLDQAYAEIRATDAVIDDLYTQARAKREHRIFRFPYGDKGDLLYSQIGDTPSEEGQRRRNAIQAYLRRLGHTPFGTPSLTYPFYDELGLRGEVDWYWTYDTLDWAMIVDDKPHGLDSYDKIVARMDEDSPQDWLGLNFAGSSDIILIHDLEQHGQLFTRLVERALAKGIKFADPLA